MKKKYISIITDFSELEESHLHHWSFFYERLSEQFDQIFLINSLNIRLFPKLAQKINLEKLDYKISEQTKKLPENFTLFDPQNEKDFSNFLKDKEILVINNFGKHFWYLKVYYLLKKYKIKQVQISNFGVFAGSGRIFELNSFKNIYRTFLFLFFKNFFNKFTVILSNIGLVPKLEIRFLSNKDHLINIQKSSIKNILFKKGFLFAKDIKLINSRSYDISITKKLETSEDYIVHLDASINYKEEVELRGKWDQNKVDDHYHYLNKFLTKLSVAYKKEVKVCIHPLYDLKEHQAYFKNFEVLKRVTREYIYKSYVVTSFDSSGITDAILLKKKIIGLESSFMSENEIIHSSDYPRKVGYLHLNTINDYNFDPINLLEKMEQKIENYSDFISRYHCFDKDKVGSDEIIKILKEKFFKNYEQ